MWRLTITHGDYENLRTITHDSENEHDWLYAGDGHWTFSGNDNDGNVEWSAIVSELRSAVDVKLVEPASQPDQAEPLGVSVSDRDLGDTQVISTVAGGPPPSGSRGPGATGTGTGTAYDSVSGWQQDATVVMPKIVDSDGTRRRW